MKRVQARCSMVILVLAVLCAAGSVSAQSRLQVMVSILPQKYFVEKIGGDLVNVSVMVEPGVDPHVYEPKPQAMVALSKAALYFAIGVPFEKVWLQKFSTINPALLLVHTEEHIALSPMEPEHSNEDSAHGKSPRSASGNNHEHESYDPHIWLSPPMVMMQARNILCGLIKADPDHQATYETNYGKFIEEIVELDRELLDSLSGKDEGKQFMVFHPSWGYFAEAYGLKQIAVEVEGKEPKAAEIKRLIEYAREHKIKVIFVQPQFSTTSAKVIADAIGGQLVSTDPLSPDWTRNLREVGEKFKMALR